MTRKFVLVAALASVGVGISGAAQAQGAASAQQANMTFFVTSAGKGNGADLGGLEGADAHCAALAKAAGAKATNWRAYLSTALPGGDAGVNARDRIGKGPWRNAKGVVVARNVNDLHSASNKINKQTALTEKGEMVNGSGDTPNLHDILTGSAPNGMAMGGKEDRTCRNWTSSGAGAAMVGHHDRTGLGDDAESKSWNSSHQTRGCSEEALRATGGGGLLYCFAVN